MTWETVIGLEVHVQLRTRSKIFSSAPTAYGAEPNTQANAVDLGYPGVLPVLNAAAVRMAVKFGLACDAEIAPRSVFARKNYFYPDLPKGYQISQYELPIVGPGKVAIVLEDGSEKIVGITRAHLEEDAGKSIHDRFADATAIDLNRAGTPLLEIVSEPDMRSAAEAVAYLKKIHALVRYLDVSDGNMQEGSFRCDANVSVRPAGSDELGTRTEIKNLNSFRFIDKAINVEVERQIDVLEDGGAIVQETRLYDAERNQTRPMRSKEEANDYRYFPDPDLLPVIVEPSLIDALRAELPELPDARRARYCSEHGLTLAQAEVITASRPLADYFEAVIGHDGAPARLAANWLTGEFTAALNQSGLEAGDCPVSAVALAGLLARIEDGTISGKIAKDVFAAMWRGEGDADAIIDARGLRQISDTAALEAIVDDVVAAHPQQVGQYRGGKEQVLGFFVGQVMKRTQGKANPGAVNALLKKKLAGD